MSESVEFPKRFEYLHMLTPAIMDTIIHDALDKKHPWYNPKLKPTDPYALIPRRPAALMNPEWDKILGQREDFKNPETVYGHIYDTYHAEVSLWLASGQPEEAFSMVETRTALAAWCVFWGLILNKRHTWDWSLLPDKFRQLLPDDPYGPETK